MTYVSLTQEEPPPVAIHSSNPFQTVVTEFCLSASILIRQTIITFNITSVYGPTASARKDNFFEDLVAQKPATNGKWLALGDFNQIYRTRDKNRRNVNRSHINRFRAALNSCELKEIHLQNRHFIVVK
jgi:hypothetical protein